MLCSSGLLAYRSVEQGIRSSWHHLHHGDAVRPHLHLASLHKQSLASLRCALRARFRNWSQHVQRILSTSTALTSFISRRVCNRSRLRRRNRSSSHSWRARYAGLSHSVPLSLCLSPFPLVALRRRVGRRFPSFPVPPPFHPPPFHRLSSYPASLPSTLTPSHNGADLPRDYSGKFGRRLGAFLPFFRLSTFLLLPLIHPFHVPSLPYSLPMFAVLLHSIMLGTVSSLVFFKVPDPTSAAITGLNWRLMLGSAALPAFLVMAQVFFCPESPRFVLHLSFHLLPD